MKRILITSMNVGGGHRMPAVAVEEALQSLYPNEIETRVVDFAREVGARRTDFILKKSWEFMLGHPGFTNSMYDTFLTGTPRLSTLFPDLLMRDFLLRAPGYIERYAPDLIVSTYFFSTHAAIMARRQGRYAGEIVQMVVDPFTAHPWWAMNLGCEEHLVASEQARARLVELGVPAERVTRVAFPLRGDFECVESHRDQIHRRFGLNPEWKTILISPGGEGITNIPEFVMAICRYNLEFNILYVCGNSAATKREMERFLAQRETATRVVPLGYVSDMPTLLSAADFAIAKPGASTTMEMLVLRKPVVFTQYCGYQEKANVDYVVNNRLGWYLRSISEMLLLMRSINESNLLDSYQRRLDALNLASGSREIARRLAARIGLS